MSGSSEVGNGPLVTTPLRGSRGYAMTLVLGVSTAACVAVGATQQWVTARAVQVRLPTLEVSVSGTQLTPLVGAIGLVMLAAFGAVVATRGRLRQALGLAIVGCAAVAFTLAIRSGDETRSVEAALSARGWLGGSYDTATSPWRWLVAAGASGCALAGVSVACLSVGWATMGNRYEAPRDSAAPPRRSRAQAGTAPDPPAAASLPPAEASSSPSPPADAAAAPSPPADAAAAPRSPPEAELNDADVWRALDRGDDPTQRT